MPRLAALQPCLLPAASPAPAVVTFLKLGSDPVLLLLGICRWPPPGDRPGLSIHPALRAHPPRQPLTVVEKTEPGEVCRASLAAEERSRVRAQQVHELRLWASWMRV